MWLYIQNHASHGSWRSVYKLMRSTVSACQLAQAHHATGATDRLRARAPRALTMLVTAILLPPDSEELDRELHATKKGRPRKAGPCVGAIIPLSQRDNCRN